MRAILNLLEKFQLSALALAWLCISRPGLCASSYGKDLIQLKSGVLVQGEILAQDVGNSVTLKDENGKTAVIKVADIETISKETILEPKIKPPPKPARLLNPNISMWSSILIPGVGQFYNKEPIKGIAMLVLAYTGVYCTLLGNSRWHPTQADGSTVYGPGSDAANPVSPLFYLGLAICGGTWVWSAMDAPKSANRLNHEHGYGHLLEYDADKLTVGIEVFNTCKSNGAACILNF